MECWEVVGGSDKGGILVRAGKDTSSEQLAERLAKGAVVEELELIGERLHYCVISGTGPRVGWVSLKLKGKELVSKIQDDKALRLARKNAADRDNKNAATGPGPHNGPTMVAFQRWMYETVTMNYPELKVETALPKTDGNEKAEIEAMQAVVRQAYSAQKAPLSEQPPAEDSIEANVSAGKAAPSGWLSRYGLTRVANFRDNAVSHDGDAYKCTGGRVRRGMLFRTGQWNSATLSDLTRIRDEFGIKTYIDLRTGETFEGARASCYDEDWYPPCPSGRQKDFKDRKPGELRRVHCPFTKALKMRPWTTREKKLQVNVDATNAEDRRETCSWWYQQMIRSEAFTDLITQLSATMRAVLLMNYDEVLKAMKVVAEPLNYPVAYGCMAGKDRTGIFGQLVLYALGVSQEDILADYLATNRSSAHISACITVMMSMYNMEMKEFQPKVYEMMVKQGRAPKESDNPTFGADDNSPLWNNKDITSDEANLLASRVYKEILQYTFHVLNTECGGVLNYLDSIGFGPDDVQRLREILVESDE